MRRAVLVLPFVPVMWMTGYEACWLPQQVGQRRDPREGRLDPVLRPATLQGGPELCETRIDRHVGESRPGRAAILDPTAAAGREGDERECAGGEATSRGSWGTRHLADTAIDVVLEATLQTEMVWVSPSVTEVLGWQPAELVGKYAADIVHPDDVAEVGALAQALSERGPCGRLAFHPADEGGWVQGAATTGTPGRGRGRSPRRPHHHHAGHQRA